MNIWVHLLICNNMYLLNSLHFKNANGKHLNCNGFFQIDIKDDQLKKYVEMNFIKQSTSK